MKVICILIIVILQASLIRANENTDYILKQEWTTWKIQMDKVYMSHDEEMYRFDIWKSNYEMILNHNKQNNSYTLGLNKFSDLTLDEFRNKLGLKQIKDLPKDICEKIQVDTSQQVPKSIDWRKKGVVNAIKDQFWCGSCWAFSAASSIESAWAIRNHTLLDLSEQQLVDCSKREHNVGCYGGLVDNAFNYTIRAKGLCISKNYPYIAFDEKCIADKCTHVVTISKCHDLWTDNASTTEEVMGVTLTQQPISVAVYAGNSLWMNYKSGIIDNAECGNQDDHAVVIVGYNTTGNGQDYWIVRNSWGKSWGLDGYVYVAKGKNMCGIAECPSYPVI